ncbi:MAG: hypothetical protein KDB37_05515 [Ilumatobacter sp.]|nr:hypothetical protein [Ilumatobacter sp.]
MPFIDYSEVDRLAELLGAAGEQARDVSNEELTLATVRAAADAHANARRMADTGETAAELQWDTSGEARRIWSTTRASRFQEFGSPNTGPPNPWLTGPARAASTRLAEAMASRIDPLG